MLHDTQKAHPRVVAVGVEIDKLVAPPAVTGAFERLLCDWKAELERFPPGSRIKFLPRRRLNMAEKYARMLAILDVVCEHVKRIDPWRGRKLSYGRAKSSAPYLLLKAQVEQLRHPDDLQRIEDMLVDVKADLATQAALKVGRAVTGRRPSPPEDADWLTVTEAERISDINKGTISRAADNGEFKTNGERGQKRRLERASFNNWHLKRAGAKDRGESESAVKAKFKRTRYKP